MPDHDLEVENRRNNLLMAAIVIAAVDAIFIFCGFIFDEQLLIALGTCIFALAVFLFVYLNASDEEPEFIQKVISVAAWIMILQLVLLAIGPSWSKSGIILCFFAIGLFGAAVVNGWGTDVEWVKKYAVRFAVVLFVLCMFFILSGANISFKSIGRTWKSLTASVSSYVGSKELARKKERELAAAQRQLDALRQEPKQAVSQLPKVQSVRSSRKVVFDEDYWRAKRELEAWRAQVNSL